MVTFSVEISIFCQEKSVSEETKYRTIIETVPDGV